MGSILVGDGLALGTPRPSVNSKGGWCASKTMTKDCRRPKAPPTTQQL